MPMDSAAYAGRHVVVVGDVILDRDVNGDSDRLCPDAPTPVVDVEAVLSGPGGAGLAAVICARAGAATTLIAPIADDAAGQELCASLHGEGVDVIPLGHEGATRVKTRMRSRGVTLARYDEGGPAHPVGELPEGAVARLLTADAVLVADYGAGTSGHPAIRHLLEERIRRHRAVIWDPHPRGGAPVPGCCLVTPNLAEARRAVARASDPAIAPAAIATALRTQWSADALCVTTGDVGAWLATTSPAPYFTPTDAIPGADTCGAGDCLAATATLAIAAGRTITEAVSGGVRSATAWVRNGGTSGFRAGPLDPVDPVEPVAETFPPPTWPAVRDHGGTVVATGGCFDLLHAGHLASLEAARSLGDTLVVLLNSDDSIRRRKGPNRPVQTVRDRERLLRSLRIVDDVIVFDEDDPSAALRRLRPDIWAKGGDYDADMPEAEVVRSWGGEIVLLPYLDGHSTTALLRGRSKETHDELI